MKKCSKCGKTIYNTDISYCPDCGNLLPGEKSKILILASEKERLEKGAASRPPEGMAEFDKRLYEDAINFYKIHLTTGYAPKGKVVIEEVEYDRLKKAEEEFEQNKKTYGTQRTFSTLNGKLTLINIPNYGVSKSTVNRIVDISFGDFWKKLYENQNNLTRIAIQSYYWWMIASCSILVISLFAKQNTWDTTIGVIMMLSGMVIFFWIALSVFDYD